MRELEAELARLRRSRRVLLDVLWRLEQQWRFRMAVLESENRRLLAKRWSRGGTGGIRPV